MLSEFLDKLGQIHSLKINSMEFDGRPVDIQHNMHSTESQSEPNGTAHNKLEEVFAKFKDGQNVVYVTIDKVILTLGRSRSRSKGRGGKGKGHKDGRHSISRSRSRSRSYSRGRSHRGHHGGGRHHHHRSHSRHGCRHYSRSPSKGKVSSENEIPSDGADGNVSFDESHNRCCTWTKKGRKHGHGKHHSAKGCKRVPTPPGSKVLGKGDDTVEGGDVENKGGNEENVIDGTLQEKFKNMEVISSP